MRKTKITSFEKEGVRGGRSLEGVLAEIDIHREGERSLQEENDEIDDKEQILQICRLSFTSTDKAKALGRLILSRVWNKIILEKTTGRFVSLVLQDSVISTRILEVKQHQRYDSIKWNFGLDWFPIDSGCPLQEIHFTGVRFRGGEELKFLRSLAEGLERGAASPNDRPIGLRVLELNACRFNHPDIQYPILFRGLRVACFGTLERLWMPKSPGLDDERFEELFGEVLLSRENDRCSSIAELGFSYNGCGSKGSGAVCSYLQSPQSTNLKVLYLNRQHGELDLEGILRAAVARTGKLQLNLSQNYVSSLETLEQLQGLSASQSDESNGSDKQLSLDVQLDSMSFEVPEVVIPGNVSNQHHENKGKNGATRQKSYEDHVQNLSQEEIAKLNVACGRVKYLLGRAAAACNRNNASPLASSQSNPSSNTQGDGSTGSDCFFSSLAAFDCVLPDLLTILRLQQKQNTPKSKENEAINGQQQTQSHHSTRQYRNWLPTFLRKAIKGNIEILKPWLLSASQGPNGAVQTDGNKNSSAIDGGRPPVILTEWERDRLKSLWNEIEALHTNIAHHSGQRRHKHSMGDNSGEISAASDTTKTSRTKKHNRKSPAEIPMTPQENPLVNAAFQGIPAIPTSILESSNDGGSPFLSLPTKIDDATNSDSPKSNRIRAAPPIFIDTVESLEELRDNLFRRPPPHKIPKMVAVDSEWYFTQNAHEETQQPNSGARSKRVKHRSMSVATLQIAYVDENKCPMVLRSFVIDLLSNQAGFQTLAKEFVSWLFGSASCVMMVLGFAFGGDLRQLRKYAGITGNGHKNQSKNTASDSVASLEVVASRCLDIQHLLASRQDIQKGRVPGLKKCAELYFTKPLKKDDQTSDWRERPLRPSQLEYAALDAVILLVLLSQKMQADKVAPASSVAL